MYFCRILLLSLATISLAGSSSQEVAEDAESSDLDQNQDSALMLNGLCLDDSSFFFCFLRCLQQDLGRPSCDSQRGCVCVPDEDVSGDTEMVQWAKTTKLPDGTTIEPDSGEIMDSDESGEFPFMFFMFDFGGLYPDDKDAVDFNTGEATDLESIQDDVSTSTARVSVSEWASAHVMAVIIIALLFVLTVVEVLTCLKKRKAKHNVSSIFNSSEKP